MNIVISKSTYRLFVFIVSIISLTACFSLSVELMNILKTLTMSFILKVTGF